MHDICARHFRGCHGGSRAPDGWRMSRLGDWDAGFSGEQLKLRAEPRPFKWY